MRISDWSSDVCSSDLGVQVVYGVVGYKTHAKMLLVVRREGRKLRRYVHLGTGNYHAGTARAYTDLGLITADPAIGNDVHLIFQQLSGLAPAIRLRSEEHTSELQSLMRISYAVFCLKKKKETRKTSQT